MHNIRVQFTVPSVEKVVTLDVHVNGEKRNMRFRVETFDWDSQHNKPDDLIFYLRNQIHNYDRDWQLYHIGAPFKNKIPVTFQYNN